MSEAWVRFLPGQGASIKTDCKDAEGTLCCLFMKFLDSSCSQSERLPKSCEMRASHFCSVDRKESLVFSG